MTQLPMPYQAGADTSGDRRAPDRTDWREPRRVSRPDVYRHPAGLEDRLTGRRLYRLDVDARDGRTHARIWLFFADPEDLDLPAPPTTLPTRPFVAARAARWLAAHLAGQVTAEQSGGGG